MIIVAGLGPGDYARIPSHVRDLVLDGSKTVIARTREHPAAEYLAELRPVVFCDDIYQRADSFEDVYDAIARRVLEAADEGDVVYLVPGSPLIGELTVGRLVASGRPLDIIPSESFVDLILARVGYDPLDRGLQILNAHDLPDPLVLDKPTIIAQLDRPEILADVVAQVDGVAVEGWTLTVLRDLGTAEEVVVITDPASVDPGLAGLRTSLFVDTAPGGLIGAVRTMRLLREECPWDREQTHHSLVKNLVEEVYELIEAIEAVPDEEVDVAAYAAVEDELGDVLLQVLFHEAIGRQTGVFDLDSVAEGLRQKLVRRHPHVFGDVAAGTAGEVKENWDRIKEEEEGGREGGSVLDGVPAGMPALHRAAKLQNRAAKVGFDWDQAVEVLAKVREEIAEVESDLGDPSRVGEEVGDLLFSVVNLARHLGVDPELALRGATSRFEHRFRRMEDQGPLAGLTLAEMDQRWERAKSD